MESPPRESKKVRTLYRLRPEESLHRMGIPIGSDVNVGAFSEGQRRHLEYHRDLVFLQACTQLKNDLHKSSRWASSDLLASLRDL
jgi:hypothetical protein